MNRIKQAAIIKVRRLTTSHKYRMHRGEWQVLILRSNAKPYWRPAFRSN